MQNLENYTKEKLTIDLVWANNFALLSILPIVIMYGLPYLLIWGWNKTGEAATESTLLDKIEYGFLAILVFLLGIIVHELIHGITWALYAQKGFKSIKFGVWWKMLTPYCHCKEPMKVKNYRLGAIMPAIFLGLLPGILANVIGHRDMLLFGGFFTLAAAGDILIIHKLRNENKEDYVQDHPSEAGCYIYRKKEEL